MITKELFNGVYSIYIDGVSYTTKEAAEKLGIPEKSLITRCRSKKKEDFEAALKETIWRYKNGVSPTEKIYIVDGVKTTIHIVSNKVGVNPGTAGRRIKDAIQYGKPYSWVIRPADPERVKIGKTSKRKIKAPVVKTPRKKVSDIPSPGSWERKQLEKNR